MQLGLDFSSSTNGSPERRKSMIIMLRWVLVIATACLVLFSDSNNGNQALVQFVVVALVLSNLLLSMISEKVFLYRWFDPFLLVGDICFVSFAIWLSGQVDSDLYLLYFLVIIIASVNESLSAIILSACLVSAGYLWTLAVRDGLTAIMSTEMLIRVPFFFIVALFYAYFAGQVRKERQTKLAMQQKLSVATQLRRLSDAVASTLERNDIVLRLVRGIADLTQVEYAAVISRGAENFLAQTGDHPRFKFIGESWEKGVFNLLSKLLVDAAKHSPQVVSAVLPTEASPFERKAVISSFRLISGRIHFLPVSGNADSDLYLLLVGELDYNMLEYIRVVLVSASAALSKSGQYQELLYEVENRKIISEHLGKALEFRDQFVANVTHEVRTPICSTIGFVELLLKGAYGELGGEQRAVLARVLENSTSLLQLVNNILDHSKVEAGKMQIRLGEDNVRDFVGEILETCEPLIKDRALVLERKGEIPSINLILDWGLFRQIAINLISNAIKFTPRGRVSVAVSCDPVMKELHLSVTDTGVGIPPERIGELFQPFKQLDNAYTKKFAGTGLGLALTKKYIELMRGTIDVQSVPGEGSCFSVHLPIELPARSIKTSSVSTSLL